MKGRLEKEKKGFGTARYWKKKETEARLSQLVYPVPVMATLKLKEVMLVLIEDETVSVKVALTDAPAARL
jgi:hypothetical protein